MFARVQPLPCWIGVLSWLGPVAAHGLPGEISSGAGLGAPPAAEHDGARAVVLVAPAAPEGAAARVLEVIRAQLSEMPIRLVIEPATGGAQPFGQRIERALELSRRHRAAGTFWVDLAEQGDLLLYLFEPLGKKVLVRRVPVPDSKASDVAAEEMGLIARATVVALLEGREIGMEAAETAAPQPPARPSPAPLPREGREERPSEPARADDPGAAMVIASYVGTRLDERIDQHGLAVGAGVRHRWARLAASYTFVRELHLEAAGTTTTAQRHPMEVAAGIFHVFHPFALGFELGVVAELYTRRSEATDPILEPTPAEHRWLWALSPRVFFSWSATAELRLFAAAGPETLLNRFDFIVQSGPDRRVVFAPWSVRPRLQIGATIDVW